MRRRLLWGSFLSVVCLAMASAAPRAMCRSGDGLTASAWW